MLSSERIRLDALLPTLFKTQTRKAATNRHICPIYQISKAQILLPIKSASHTQDLTVQEYARNTQPPPGTAYYTCYTSSTLNPSVFLSLDVTLICVVLATKISNNYNSAWPDFYSKL